MKKIECEMCGSNDFVKNGGFFVCQHCGCKYTVEEAKKLMVEGTVKLDNTDKINNLYVLARRAKDADDAENAIRYYNEIMQEVPNDWEPVFYSAYFSLISCKIIQVPVAAETFANNLTTVCDLINQSNDDEEKKGLYDQVLSYTLKATRMIFQSAESMYNKYKDTQNALGDYIKGGQDGLRPSLRLGDILQQCKEYELALNIYLQVYNFVSKIRINYLVGFDMNPFAESVKLIEQKIIDCYMKKNEGDFASLKNERKQLQRELNEAESNQSNSQASGIEKLINDKQLQLKKLGIFEQKEKKKIKQELVDLQSQLEDLKGDYYRNTVLPLKNKIQSIDSKLNPNIDYIKRMI